MRSRFKLLLALITALAVPAYRPTLLGAQQLEPTAPKPAANDPVEQPAKDKPVKVTISKKMTYITEPLRPDGYPDYIRYFDEKLRQGVTPDNNATVLLLRSLGPGELAEEELPEFFKRLGIDPLPFKGDYFVDWITYSKRFSAKDWPPVPRGLQQTAEEYFESLDDEAMGRPWTHKDFPLLAKWLDAHDKHIDQFVAASRRPRMYTPVLAGDEARTLIAVLVPVVNNNRQAARALATRATYRAGNGDMEGAIDDLMAAHRLARLTAEGFTLVESLVGLAMDHIVLDSEAALIASGRLTASDRAKMRKALAELPPMPPMADVLDQGERFMFADTVCWIAREGAGSIGKVISLTGTDSNTLGAVSAVLNVVGELFVDWDVALTTGREWNDRLVEVARIDDPKKQREAIAAFEASLQATVRSVRDGASLLGLFFSPRYTASRKIADTFVGMLMPALTSALNAEHRHKTRHTLVNIALALADYRDEHGKFPETLEALGPKFLERIPLDPMWGEPFVYKKTDAGCLLYGVGQNGQDDGGRTMNEFDDADDLAIGLTIAPKN
jgi:type II secretory pathway pseudopilin PulG